MYKNLIICVNETEGRDKAILAAARFAKQLNANLTGLYVKGSINYLSSAYGLSPYGSVATDLVKLAEEEDAKLTAKASDDFHHIVKDVKCKSTWLEVSDADKPLRAIMYSDLVITNQVNYDPRQGHSNTGFINTLILESGKPVILIPTDWDEANFGTRVVIGWDESREASRAVQDAMPILINADHVDTICVDYKQREEEAVDVSEISTYLSKHDVANSFHLKSTDDKSSTPEKVLMNFASKNMADLIVVGGYGHTRLREIILGGVTRSLSKYSEVPVFFSH